MANYPAALDLIEPELERARQNLAIDITRAASRQTNLTIRLLVDRGRRLDAYRAYGYFRWLDDQLDQDGMSRRERLQFASQQHALMDRCYHGELPQHPGPEEAMLVDLIHGDREHASGLQAYIRNMMSVMTFDAERRGRLISTQELNQYTLWLATAVTEALHYFIGHGSWSPHDGTRYLAVTAAHITHMLRDTLEDLQAGYINIPLELVQSCKLDPYDAGSPFYKKYIQKRVQLARTYFNLGKSYLSRVASLRCRAAGYAYIARFDSVLSAIQQDDYCLRSEYPECKNLRAAARMLWSICAHSFSFNPMKSAPSA